jgi:hypothetical protein
MIRDRFIKRDHRSFQGTAAIADSVLSAFIKNIFKSDERIRACALGYKWRNNEKEDMDGTDTRFGHPFHDGLPTASQYAKIVRRDIE